MGRKNNELQKFIKGEDIVIYTKAQKTKWWGHLNRMENVKLRSLIGTPPRIRTKEQLER